MELESCNFKEEDIKPFKCTTQNILEFDWLTTLYTTHQRCQTVCVKCVKLLSGKDCEILVIENVAFDVDLGTDL